MCAGVAALRALRPARIVAAAPVGSAEACQRVRAMADECVCAFVPRSFIALAPWYGHFDQTSDEEVRALLAESSGAVVDGAA
jgi:putative phosphoribosyl transferase